MKWRRILLINLYVICGISLVVWFGALPLRKVLNKPQAIAVYDECVQSFEARVGIIAESLRSFHNSEGHFPYDIEEWARADSRVNQFFDPLPYQLRPIEIWLEMLHQKDGELLIVVPDPGCRIPLPFDDLDSKRAMYSDLQYNSDAIIYQRAHKASMKVRANDE